MTRKTAQELGRRPTLRLRAEHIRSNLIMKITVVIGGCALLAIQVVTTRVPSTLTAVRTTPAM